MIAHDTSRTARRYQLAAFAGLSGAERVGMAAQMAEQARAIAVDGIRARHPGIDDAGVHRAWLCLLHGEDVAARVVGSMPPLT